MTKKIIPGRRKTGSTFSAFLRDEDARVQREAETRRVAHSDLVKAGHGPVRQGNSFECFRCGRSGTLDATTGEWVGEGTLGKEKCDA